MREILFRGKIKQPLPDEFWRYGGIVHQTDYYGKECDRWFVIDGTNTQDYDIGYEYEVIPNTVGQYIGKSDKNNNLIFEGDICRAYLQDLDCNDGSEYEEGIFVVKWKEDNAMFVLSNDSQDLEFGYLSSCKVIGNIHDNPKLLRGELT